jgi:twitching motility protein PilT
LGARVFDQTGITGVANGPAPPGAVTAGPGGQDAAPLADEHTRLLLDDLLEACLTAGASDLHLSPGVPPMIRVNGTMEPVDGYQRLHPTTIQRAVFAVLTSAQRDRFEGSKELDCSYTLPGRARFRVNVMRQRGAVSAVLRAVPWRIQTLPELGLPEHLARFAALPRGLVLVTGPTGSGKSTTLASLVEIANQTRRGHIVTVEDPIEFLFEHKGCVVNQREVGDDTNSFAEALRHVLRQDPDIIVVGEMRDLETMATALTAAETGHLVFATLHTRSAQEAVTRIVDSFPAGQQNQIRVQLASALHGVIAQELVRTYDGLGRIPAIEVLVATPAVRNLIRENKIAQLTGVLESGAQHGMQSMDQGLAHLVTRGRITFDDAASVCRDPAELDRLVRSGGDSPAGSAAYLRGAGVSNLTEYPAF